VIALGGDCSRVCTGELGSVAAARRGVLVGLCLGLLEMRCVGSMGKTTRLPSQRRTRSMYRGGGDGVRGKILGGKHTCR